MHARVRRPRYADECRLDRLPVDGDEQAGGILRRHLDGEVRDARLDLRELRGGLVTGLAECFGRSGVEIEARDAAVRLGRFDELEQRGLALGDVECRRRRGERIVRALEFVERVREPPRLLKRGARDEKLAHSLAIRVGDLLLGRGGRGE